MGIWLGSWAGDHAGAVEGRQPNRLLISLTHTDGTFPPGLFKKGDLGGVPWYFDVNVTCLTPGVREAIATTVDDVGDYVWSIEVAEVDWSSGKAPWKPGVHLFSVMLLAIGFGLGQVFAAFPALYTVLKVVSVVYLSWLAWKLASATAVEVAEGGAAGRPMTFLEGAAFQWVNPKAWAICLSVVAAYTIPAQFISSIMTAATLFLAINLLCVAVWTGFGVALKRILQNRRWLRIFNVAMALLLVASLIPLLLDRHP